MSLVTNAILSMSVLDEEEGRLTEVNKFFEDGGKGYTQKGFISCHDIGSHWYGGSRFLMGCVAIGAFNYLDVELLKEHLLMIPWIRPEQVQLMIKTQDADRFEMWNFPEPEPTHLEKVDANTTAERRGLSLPYPEIRDNKKEELKEYVRSRLVERLSPLQNKPLTYVTAEIMKQKMLNLLHELEAKGIIPKADIPEFTVMYDPADPMTAHLVDREQVSAMEFARGWKEIK